MNRKEPPTQSAARVLIHLDFPGLFPQAVMYSLVDTNPRLAFPAALHAVRKAQPSHTLVQAPNALLACLAWDELSAQTSGSRMMLAVPKDYPSPTESGSLLVHETALVVSSSGPPTTRQRWLLSRSSMFKDRAVAWCLPVSLAPGSTQTIVLNQGNATDLETLSSL